MHGVGYANLGLRGPANFSTLQTRVYARLKPGFDRFHFQHLLPLIQTRWLPFFGHVARMGDSHDLFRALHTSIRGPSKDWRRRPGRPRHTWLQTLEADLQLLNHGLNSAWRQGRWRQLIETATLQSGACPWGWVHLSSGR